MEANERSCKECGEELRGRIDQKFCSDQCRTAYNNNLNRDLNSNIRNVNYILRKNRRILAKLNPYDKRKISRDDLTNLGFDFRYHTKTYTNRKGQTYYFCYEQGYLRLNDTSYYLVKDLISKS
jgi:predicted nucleic acid-binding Zn ribbon protein